MLRRAWGLDKHLAVGQELPLIRVRKEMTPGKPGWLIPTGSGGLGFSAAEDLRLAVDLRARSEGILMTCNAPQKPCNRGKIVTRLSHDCNMRLLNSGRCSG